MDYWSATWAQRKDCRQTKQWFPTVDISKSSSLLKLDRTLLSQLVQLITGHNFLKRHEALVSKDEDNLCRLCEEEEESSYHIITECPALARVRFEILGTTSLVDPSDWSVNQVIRLLREASVDDLMGWNKELE